MPVDGHIQNYADARTPLAAGDYLELLQTPEGTRRLDVAALATDVELAGKLAIASNLSDLGNKFTARTNLSLGDTVFVGGRSYYEDATFPTSILQLLPGPAIANVAKLFTCPAGYMASFTTTTCLAGATGATFSLYVMEDAVTTPVAADRIYMATVGANASATSPGHLTLTAGQSLWGWATVDAALTFAPNLALYKIPSPNMYSSNFILKGLALGDTTVYTCPAGKWAQPNGFGVVHNTTGAAITLTFKIFRASDSATFTVLRSPANANVSVFGIGSTAGSLQPGDALIVNPAAVGLNFSTIFMTKPEVV